MRLTTSETESTLELQTTLRTDNVELPVIHGRSTRMEDEMNLESDIELFPNLLSLAFCFFPGVTVQRLLKGALAKDPPLSILAVR